MTNQFNAFAHPRFCANFAFPLPVPSLTPQAHDLIDDTNSVELASIVVADVEWILTACYFGGEPQCLIVEGRELFARDTRAAFAYIRGIEFDQREGEASLIALWKSQQVPHAVKVAVESLHSEYRRGRLQAFEPIVEDYTGTTVADRVAAGFGQQ